MHHCRTHYHNTPYTIVYHVLKVADIMCCIMSSGTIVINRYATQNLNSLQLLTKVSRSAFQLPDLVGHEDTRHPDLSIYHPFIPIVL